MLLSLALGVALQVAYPEDSFKAARDFARCRALYERFAEVLEVGDRPASAEEYQGMARGAWLTAHWFAFAYNPDPEIATELIENAYLIEANRQGAFAERSQVDTELALYCHQEMQPIQVMVIDALRRGTYADE
jgi:hypothetical protein